MPRKKTVVSVKKQLHTIGAYDSISLERFNEIAKENPGFEKYELELEDDPGGCGCWDSCSCVNVRGFIFGWRPETKDECKAREKKFHDIQVAHQQDIKQRELAQLKKLKQKYKL